MMESHSSENESGRTWSSRMTMEHLTLTCLGEHSGIAQAGMENSDQINQTCHDYRVLSFDDILR
jgi:hypothetical protein